MQLLRVHINKVYYFGARYYDSEISRFVSMDPIKVTSERLLDPQGLNLYSYVLNNPIRLIDPTGLTWKEFFDGLLDGLVIGAVKAAEATKNAMIGAYNNMKAAVADPAKAYENAKAFIADASVIIGATLPKIFSAETYEAIYEYVEQELLAYWALDDYTRAQKAGELIGEVVAAYVGGQATAKSAQIVQKVNAIKVINVLKYEGKINQKIYDGLKKQLSKDGKKSIHKSLKTAEKTLQEHIDKLKDAEYKSSIEKTIKNVKDQIKTINQFIKDKKL